MWKHLFILNVLIIFVFNIVLPGYCSTRDEKSDPKVTQEEQSKKIKTQKFCWEFSTAASLDIRKEPVGTYSNTEIAIYLPVRIGFIINKTLEIEPEITYIYRSWDLRYYHDSDWEILFLANLAINIENSSPVTPFILGGMGFLKYSAVSAIEPYDEFVITDFVNNFGAGLKWFAADKVALRIDYRYFKHKENGVTATHHKIFFGISLFF